MAISEAKRRANEKHNSNAYDSFLLRVPKGKKELIKAYAEEHGESLAGFINRLIREEMEKNNK